MRRFTTLAALLGAAALLAQAGADPQQNEIDFGADDRVEQEKFQTVIEGLCKDRPKDEYFRLSTESNCRDAVRCVVNDFKGGHSLAAVRCPTGLLFDLDGQTCDWAAKVSLVISFISEKLNFFFFGFPLLLPTETKYVDYTRGASKT